MRIRLGILGTDQRYISQLSNFLATRYAAQLEISQFSAVDDLMAFIGSKQRIDILLAFQESLPDPSEVPEKIIVAYLVEDRDVASISGKPAICKYQRAEDIFREVESLAASLETGKKKYAVNGHCRIVTVMGACGGTGASTVAASLAARLSMQGKRVVYFPLQQNARPKDLFQTLGASMTKVRYEIRSALVAGGNQKKLQLKLQSMMVRDESTGVYAFDAFELPIEKRGIEDEEINLLMQSVTEICDICIFDIDNVLDDIMIRFLERSSWTLLVTDGSDKANDAKMLKSIEILDNSEELSPEGKIGIIYNRFGSHSSEMQNLPAFVEICSMFPNYKNAPSTLIMQEMIGKSFGKLEEA